MLINITNISFNPTTDGVNGSGSQSSADSGTHLDTDSLIKIAYGHIDELPASKQPYIGSDCSIYKCTDKLIWKDNSTNEYGVKDLTYDTANSTWIYAVDEEGNPIKTFSNIVTDGIDTSYMTTYIKYKDDKTHNDHNINEFVNKILCKNDYGVIEVTDWVTPVYSGTSNNYGFKYTAFEFDTQVEENVDPITNAPYRYATLKVEPNGQYVIGNGYFSSLYSTAMPQTLVVRATKIDSDGFDIFYNYSNQNDTKITADNLILVPFNEGSRLKEKWNITCGENNSVMRWLLNAPVIFNNINVDLYESFKSFSFRDCTLIKGVNINSINVQKKSTVSNYMAGTFYNCKNIQEVTFGKVTGFDGVEETSLKQLFYDCQSLKKVPHLPFKSTDCANMFYKCYSLVDTKELQSLDVSGCNDFSYAFYQCSGITDWSFIDYWDLSNGTSFGCMFADTNITSIPQLNGDGIKLVTYFAPWGYSGLKSLTYFGGFKDLRKSWTNYTLDKCINLTHQSLVDIIDCLYDFTGNGETPGSGEGTITLGTAHLAKLTDEEIAVGTNKGWTLQ